MKSRSKMKIPLLSGGQSREMRRIEGNPTIQGNAAIEGDTIIVGRYDPKGTGKT